MKLGWVAALLSLGCAGTAPAPQSDAPQAKEEVVVECVNSRADCMVAAGSACPAGYDIVDSSQQVRDVNAKLGTAGSAIPSVTQFVMRIRCR
ncbi:MAG: hypothetical protein EOO73_34005 [Myxococcales bacterium]|nr:MAG: hypothetical protein EOO73_34005 [Myxococcales bacterium]